MKPFAKTFALIVALSAFPTGADAGQRYGKQPKLMLSPDLASPWMLQVKPRHLRNIRRNSLHVNRNYRNNQRVGIDQQRSGITTASVQRDTQLRGSVESGFKQDLMPTIVNYGGNVAPGTIVVNTIERRLYLVQPGGKARRYAVGVGKPGFEWAGTHKVSRKAEWPAWRPPASMIERERKKGRELPAFMEGGVKNPLGARALYLGSSIYRIHGTNQAWSIGKAVSSGCIRMRNEDVMDLYDRVPVGAKVKVI
ncbi:MAG: L,D-transpeptidase family protein [Rhizobiaceae bacterium]|nr:L,D-transpeptidase family protein [Rhizobiaceae bacterium]